MQNAAKAAKGEGTAKTGQGGWVLALNAGSSSLKYAAFATAPEGLAADTPLHAGQVAGIAPEGHAVALEQALQALAAAGLTEPPLAIGHRVVHGGGMQAPARIDSRVLAAIKAAARLAPLHNPPALAVIAAMTLRYPDLAQVACFDTAFHAANPPEAQTIPVPGKYRAAGVRRYGFHGLSYASLVRHFPAETGRPLPERLLACHLGAGASLAAIKGGVGVATTMGFSPMDGLVMATRAGAMDSGVLLYLQREHGLDVAALERLLNKESGLLALAGTADMRAVLADDSAAARFAVSHYVYWVVRHAGSMIAAMGGVDALAFTGGIGEGAAPVRAAILAGLGWAGVDATRAFVLPAREELEIAYSVIAALQNA